MTAGPPSQATIDQASARVTEALERALVGSSLGGASHPGQVFDFATSWGRLPAQRELAGDIERAAMLRPLEDALRHHDGVLSAALLGAGMPKAVLDLLRTWMAVQVGARASILGAACAAEVRASMAGNPMALLDANVLGQALGGLSEQIVRDRERGRELFSVLKAGRKRGREYPAFQAWEGIVGGPLTTVLKALGDLDGAAAYSFFSSQLHGLAGLTPVEVLFGASVRRGRLNDARAILELSADQRLAAVVKAAQEFLADASA